ncbi:putative DNA-binding domain-containing protein [Sphingomonas sp. HT-1]|uniref:HvfC/BufC family peptide modification chaperone n=1 Tax=unclassified Sphingomonas TaxID=196159 RepID=UPI00030FAE2F|nr:MULTISPECIES: putative DNA-binding domain-containing protein [unclassified Sphingomonas]KTF68504.1 hypothetical protein ATB93_13575 [Sphingomonas sp. WG]
MTALAAAQRRMHAALIDPQADPAAAQALFASDGRLGAADGLAVYQRGYVQRMIACMREQFPALCHALGQPLFDDFVVDYLSYSPPNQPTLHNFGRRFAGWMEASRPDGSAREAWIDFMIDLAGFEYAVFQMFDAQGQEGRPAATADAPDCALRLQPAFSLGRYGFPVAGYFHAVRRGEAPRLPLPRRSHLALVRSGYVTRTILLSVPQFDFLATMLAGNDAAAALAAVAASHGFDAGAAETMWHGPNGCRARWIEWGFFVADPA